MHGAGAAVQAPCLFARLRAGPRRSRCRARGRGGSSSWTRASAADDVMGVVIVDHGSRRKASNDLLEEFVRMYKEQTGRPIVELAHMEIAEPDIEHAFGKCVEQGATTVAVSPFFLSPGRHWQEDIPTLAAEAAAKHPGIAHFVAAPIGLHPLMVDIVDSRLETCLNRLTGGGASSSLASRVSSQTPAALGARLTETFLRASLLQAPRATCATEPISGVRWREAWPWTSEANEGAWSPRRRGERAAPSFSHLA